MDAEDIFIITVGEIVIVLNLSVQSWKTSLNKSCRLCCVLGLKDSLVKLSCLFDKTVYLVKPCEIVDCGDDFLFSECPHVSFDEVEDTYPNTDYSKSSKSFRRDDDNESSIDNNTNINYYEDFNQLVSCTDYENISEDLHQKLISAESLCQNISQSNRNLQFFNMLGRMNLKLCNFNSAIENFQLAIGMYPSSRQELNILMNIGIAYSKCGDYDSASKYFQKVFETDPLIAWNRYHRALMFLQSSDAEKCKEELMACCCECRMLESKSQSLIHATEMHLNIAKLCIQMNCDILVTIKALLRSINTARCAHFLESTPLIRGDSDQSMLFTAMHHEGNRLACEAFHLLGVLLEKEHVSCLETCFDPIKAGSIGIDDEIGFQTSKAKKRKHKPASSQGSSGNGIGNSYGMLMVAAAAYSSARDMRLTDERDKEVAGGSGEYMESIPDKQADEAALLRVQQQIAKMQRSRCTSIT